jgi:hypothetical protein
VRWSAKAGGWRWPRRCLRAGVDDARHPGPLPGTDLPPGRLFSTHVLERHVKVHHILFIIWGIVFAFWLARQFSEHNKRTDK